MTTNQPAPAELGIPIGLISEHDLREQWDRQRGDAKYWTELSLAEQLAWAQTRAIAADRARQAARATQLQEAWGDMAPTDAVAGLAQLADKLREEPGQPIPPAEGEVGELVAKLRRLALQNPLGTADPTITRAAALIEQLKVELAMLRQLARPVAIPGEAYHDGMGPVTWWRFPVEEAPWVGTPGDSDWPGYHTHFTPCPLVPAPPEDCPHD